MGCIPATIAMVVIQIGCACLWQAFTSARCRAAYGFQAAAMRARGVGLHRLELGGHAAIAAQARKSEQRLESM